MKGYIKIVMITVLEWQPSPHKKMDVRARCSRTETFVKYTRTPPDRKTHNQIDHTLVDRRLHSGMLNV
jgi:hypothetical protein